MDQYEHLDQGAMVAVFGDRAIVSLSSKVFESDTTSCPKLPGANLTLGAGLFFYGAF